MNRWISNLVLGLFTLVLVTAYGVAKQPPAYSVPQLLSLHAAKTASQASQNATTTQTSPTDISARVVLADGDVVNATVVSTQELRALGLSGKESLAAGAGMLFIFDDSGSQPIWMKDMKFPIDIVWLDADKKVVHIENKIEPPEADQTQLPTYESPKPARYVLELPAGAAATSKIEVGEAVEWSQISS